MGMATSWFRGLPIWIKTSIALTGGIIIGLATYYTLVQRDKRKREEQNGSVGGKKKDVAKRVLVLGLMGSGKSSILSRLSKVEKEKREVRPTEGFNVMCVHTSTSTLNIWEVGGGDKVKQYWTNFTQDTDLLVFVVDSSGSDEAIGEAQKEFEKLVADPRLDRVPILLLANKQDVAKAKNPFDLAKQFGCNGGYVSGHQIRVLGTRAPAGLPSHPSIWEAERFIVAMTGT